MFPAGRKRQKAVIDTGAQAQDERMPSLKRRRLDDKPSVELREEMQGLEVEVTTTEDDAEVEDIPDGGCLCHRCKAVRDFRAQELARAHLYRKKMEKQKEEKEARRAASELEKQNQSEASIMVRHGAEMEEPPSMVCRLTGQYSQLLCAHQENCIQHKRNKGLPAKMYLWAKQKTEQM